jgi:radical SAM-linked protein
VADVIEAVWRDGGRFDGWGEMFDLGRWQRALEAHGISPARYLGTIPVTARLPWDHIDIGLEADFNLKEYRKALKDRLSPPCGKPFGKLLHHTNVEDALAEKKRLVCYDCGVACDLTMMREERIVYLTKLGALAPAPPRETPARATPRRPGRDGKKPQPAPQFTQGEGTRYRLRYTKLLRAAFISHLDVMRLLQRVFRRAQLEVTYSLGFHPKPNMQFGPALGLGLASLGEMVDVRIDGTPAPEELVDRLNQVSPEGIHFTGARLVPMGLPGLSKLVHAADFAFAPQTATAAGDLRARAEAFLAKTEVPVVRDGGTIDARRFVVGFDVLSGDQASKLRAALDWSGGSDPVLTARIKTSAEGSVKPVELADLLGLTNADLARLALVGLRSDGDPFDPLDPPPVVPHATARIPTAVEPSDLSPDLLDKDI